MRKTDGLSPLARGTLSNEVQIALNKRFIPTGAGNSSESAELLTEEPVYPRWRGELNGKDIGTSTATGLSPLARGTPISMGWCWATSRFIPAGAGNSRRSRHDASR